MAKEILSGKWAMNDVFTVTSLGSVKYNDLLKKALRSIGGCYPQGVDGDDNPADNSKTPYALIGSLGLGSCGGYEAVGDDNKYSSAAKISKFWSFDAKSEGGFDTDAPEPIYGCTDPDASNYKTFYTEDDGSCTYNEAGCMRQEALNWDKVKDPKFDYCKSEYGYVSETECTLDSECVSQHGTGWTCDGSCEYAEVEEAGTSGCTVPEAWNYNPMATVDDGSCGCFETMKFKDLPPPYDVACQPGPEHPGTQNMSNCTCEYPNVSVSWSRKASNCGNYNFWNTKADCSCTCKSNKSSIAPDKSWGDLGDCAASGNDDNNCKTMYNNKCASLSTSVSGKPSCGSGETWNGSFCQSDDYRKGGKVRKYITGGPTPVSKNINEGPSTEINPDIILPKRNLELDLPGENLEPKKYYKRGGRTKPKPKRRR